MKISNILKFGFAMLILTSIFLTPLASVLAHGNHNAAQGNGCMLRANVSIKDAKDITGNPKLTGSYTAGQRLGLGGGAGGEHAIICTFGFIKFVANLLFFVIIAIAILVIAWAAFLFVSSGEDANKRDRARSFLLYGIIGLVVAFVANLIPNIVRGIIF